MADNKISQLPDAAALDGADLIELEQPGQPAGMRSRKGTLATLLAWVQAGLAGFVTSVNGATGTPIIRQALAIACSDETTALTAGNNKVKFINPYSTTFNLVAVVASLSTAQTGNGGGGIFTVDINEAGASILSTKLTIDNGETNSSTAATPPVISDASIAAYAEITVDIDQIGDGTAKGLKVYLIGYPTP